MYLIKNGVVHVGDGTILKDCDILTKGSTIQRLARDLIVPRLRWSMRRAARYFLDLSIHIR